MQPPPPLAPPFCYAFASTRSNSAEDPTCAHTATADPFHCHNTSCPLLLFPGDDVIISLCGGQVSLGDTFVRLMQPGWTAAQGWSQAAELTHNDDGCPGGSRQALLPYTLPCPLDRALWSVPQTVTALFGCYGNNSCSGVPLMRYRRSGCLAPPPSPPLPPAPPLPPPCPAYQVSNRTCLTPPCTCPLMLTPGFSYSIQTACGPNPPAVQGDTLLQLFDAQNPPNMVALNDDDRFLCPGNLYGSRINYTVPCTHLLGHFSLVEACFADRTCNATIITQLQPGVAQPTVTCNPGGFTSTSDYWPSD